MNDIILESISDGVFTVDSDWRITSFNRAAEEITGVRRSEALGCFCHEVFKSDMCETRCPLRKTMKTGNALINQSGYIINTHGDQVPISLSTALLKDSAGRILGGAETFRDLSEVERLRKELLSQKKPWFVGGHSPGMKSLLEELPAVADSLSTVLIGGETGTGKEVLARYIHQESPRSEGPFVTLNCGALPENLIESELFGYRRGAFTGADRDKPGKFALAQNGTLFLDEIGDLTPATQVRLLRVLQEHEYDPLGALRPEKTNARILCATHRDLAQMVEAGSFRQDLFYRIHIIRLDIPPLRERKEDIPSLAAYFLEKLNIQGQKNVSSLSAEVYQIFFHYPWPGNIRELENVLERAFVLCPGPVIGIAQLPKEVIRQGSLDTKPTNSVQDLTASSLRDFRDQADREALSAALDRNKNNKASAARDLGIDKTTLYRRMKACGLS